MNGNAGQYGHWVSCAECGKRSYESKAIAKRKANYLNARMAAYRCQFGGAGWHIGHLPEQVVRGNVSRSAIYQRPGEAS